MGISMSDTAPTAELPLAADGGRPSDEGETFERTVTVRGDQKTVELGIKTCDNCGGDMEVPADKLGNGRTSLCSINCMEDYDGY